MKRASQYCLYAFCTGIFVLTGCSSDYEEPQEPAAPAWSKALGSSDNFGGPQAGTVSVSPAGNLIITGAFSGSIDLGGGPIEASAQPNFFVAKYSAAGEPIWSAKGGGGDDQPANASMDTDGNAVIAGNFNGKVDLGSGELSGGSNLFVARFGPAGEPLWSKSYGIDQESDSVASSALGKDGSIYLTGRAGGSLNFGGGSLAPGQWQTMFISKLDSSAKSIWARAFSTVNYIDSRKIAVDNAGNTFVMGQFSGEIDLGGGPLGDFNSWGYFIVKFNTSGEFAWSRGYAPPMGGLNMVDIATDSDGNLIVMGQLNEEVDLGGGILTGKGYSDLFLLKLGADGAHRFSKRFAGPMDNGYMQAIGLGTDQNKNIFVGGTFEGPVNFGTGTLTNQGGSDIFVAQFDANGTATKSSRFGGSEWENLRSMAVDPWGNTFLFGTFNGTIDFGSGELSSEGSPRMFLARIKANN